ncbi:YSIRK-type signal peptide-containing protein [Limosilactobacillus walteri]|uniref:YSIRK-type signal peptide-containing protein n=1 Tax=Limosilactobacillus walteri TaxID=2268022 RepID=A0ABR8P7W8_9LACO|nr:YSIRK-type signal peptide-containing protein [Limosilactobacillus walteri]MBD5806798.1 YSIRK-type signal peptide-containing protein [Limosilactobacillus walteri]
MLSRNNRQEQFKKYEPKKQRFTIKKLSVGVASVLLGISFANGVSADTTDANADTNNNNDGSEQTDHNLVLNSASASTLKEATAANQASGAMPASQNPAGDLKTPVADQFEQKVASAASQAIAASASATTNDSATANSGNAASASANTSAQNSAQVTQVAASNDNESSQESAADTQTFTTQSFNVSSNATGLDNSAILAQLLGTSFIQTTATNNAPVNLSTYNPDVTYTPVYEQPSFVPSNQIAYAQYRDETNANRVFTFAADKNDPNNLYL